MSQIKNKFHKLYTLSLPIAVSELHSPDGEHDAVSITRQETFKDWFEYKAEIENTTTKVVEIRVWAESPEAAVEKLTFSLYKLAGHQRMMFVGL